MNNLPNGITETYEDSGFAFVVGHFVIHFTNATRNWAFNSAVETLRMVEEEEYRRLERRALRKRRRRKH
jgi:hypothetical protein